MKLDVFKFTLSHIQNEVVESAINTSHTIILSRLSRCLRFLNSSRGEMSLSNPAGLVHLHGLKAGQALGIVNVPDGIGVTSN